MDVDMDADVDGDADTVVAAIALPVLTYRWANKKNQQPGRH